MGISSIKALASFMCGFSLVLFLLLCLAFALGTWLWPYTINTWLVYGDKQPVIEWWMGGLIGTMPILGQLCVPAAFITFVLMLFIILGGG